MTRYVALLRGINVSGHNLIKMADLRQLCQQIGLHHVQTYIQSGNILFDADQPEAALRTQLESAVLETFGLTVPTTLRTAQAMQQIVDRCPFDPQEGHGLYVSLLVEPPAPEGIARLAEGAGAPDEYRLIGREVYILCRQPYHKSKLTNQFFEQKLGVPATARNWNTVTKLAQMAST